MSGEKRVPTRILLADDDVIFRSLCVAKLKSFGMEVVEAEDGVEAWHLLKDNRFALALLDVDMPNMDGVSLVRCIRTHPATRHMPVVMITSREDVNSVRQTLQAGATSYLTKPVNWSLFTDHIAHLLALAQGSGDDHGAETGNEGAILAASLALNSLYARQFAGVANGQGNAAVRAESLKALGDLIANLEGTTPEDIDLRRVLELSVGRGDVRGEIEAPDPMFTGLGAAFEALLAELVASAGLIESDTHGAVLSIQRRGGALRVVLTVEGASGVDSQLLGFAIKKIGILAMLNKGELFFDDSDEVSGLAFGASFDRPLRTASGETQAGAVETVTSV